MAQDAASTSVKDRVYHFISDPSHKENLSGRVRAACLTCRRKKIKCSGERNCKTCREKGLLCEGLPERKKPSRDTVSSTVLEPAFSGIERKKKPSPLKIKTQSTKSGEATQANHDISGRSGTCRHQSSFTGMFYVCLNDMMTTEEHDSSQPSFTDGDSLSSLSPATLGNEAWNINAEEGLIQRTDMPITEVPMDWDKAWVDNHWWSDDSENDARRGRRMSVAGRFDEQVKILQREAPGQGIELHEDPFRRHSISIPIASPSSSDLSCEIGSHALTTSPYGGLAPGQNPSSWWDISADMTAILGRGLSREQADLSGMNKPTRPPVAPDHHLHSNPDPTAASLADFDPSHTMMMDYYGQRCT